MTLEPFIAFFIVWRIRKNLRLYNPNAYWEKILFWTMIGMGLFFVLENALSTETITSWAWHLVILGMAYYIYKLPEFERLRTITIAVLPLVTIHIISDLIKIINISFFREIENYIQFAIVFALAWMIAMLIRSNKQNKALDKERQKTLAEEERNRFISAQKEKLELIVEERTAEITKQKDELLHAFTDLKNAQTQLVHAEKMASLGELTAGIAHEIQNPLNFVNNFSELNAELVVEMKDELITGNIEAAKEIADTIIDNEQKIIFHGKRADAIVKGMLQHSRSSSGIKESTDINELADEYLRLAYHGLRAKDKSFNATMKTDFDENIGLIEINPQDIGRVILNLITNAFYTVAEKKKQQPEGYEPLVTVSTKMIKLTTGDPGIFISVKDNGNGIPQEVLDKIFQPFFTTKPTGQGTGLGLSVSYDIVKAHGGEFKVITKEADPCADSGTEFIIQLPIL